jgi:hypothetical protein
MLFWLLAAHAVCDYPLQGDFLARAKNHTAPIPGVPFYQALGAHAFIHGGAVALITGSLWLGLAETILHAAIDYAKCDGRTSLNQDQALHVACKCLWAVLA